MMSTGEVVTAIVGGGGVLTVIGAGIKFVWNKIEARFKQIEARSDRIETELAECRKREVAAMVREADSRERRAMQITVIELLWAKVKEMDPTAPVLERARHILDELKQLAAKKAD